MNLSLSRHWNRSLVPLLAFSGGVFANPPATQSRENPSNQYLNSTSEKININLWGIIVHYSAEKVAHITKWSKQIPYVPPPRRTFVYLIFVDGHGVGDGKNIKIGHSYDPMKRVYSFRDGLFRLAHLLAQIELENKEDACELERHLHKRFNHLNDRMMGREYFHIKDDLIDFCLELGITKEQLEIK